MIFETVIYHYFINHTAIRIVVIINNSVKGISVDVFFLHIWLFWHNTVPEVEWLEQGYFEVLFFLSLSRLSFN